MGVNVSILKCPNCGASVSSKQKRCEWCGSPIIITTFNSVYSMSLSTVKKYADEYTKHLSFSANQAELNNSIAMCYLKLKLYDKALTAFENAIEKNIDNSETYFYAAICLLNGKKAFLASRSNINKAEKYINAAISIEQKGIYYYLYAYIKYDFYERKSLNTIPNYIELISISKAIGVSEYDKILLFDILNVEKPHIFN